LNKNFNSPYKAINPSDFWRRWHLSLSTFLRDYLYIPLGGNRRAGSASLILILVITVFISLLAIPYLKLWITHEISLPSPGDYIILASVLILTLFGPVSLILYLLGFMWSKIARFIHTEINLMITMLVGGLWHGASWLFVIWGGLNGLGLVIFKLFKGIKTPYFFKTLLFNRVCSILFTFTFISFTRIFFRSSDLETARNVIDQIFLRFGTEFIPERLALNKWALGLFILGMVVHWLSEDLKQGLRDLAGRSPFPVQAGLVLIIVFIIYQATGAEMTPFIYFQF